MKSTIKTGLAVILLLAISCKKESAPITDMSSAPALTTDVTEAAQKYPSIKIHGQQWMTTNLAVTHYRNGDKIPQVRNQANWNTLTTGAWCWYNNDSATGAVYGRLYNWYAVHDPRGLAPEGWHIASDSEWHVTGTFLGNTAGGKMKETGTAHWFDPNVAATNSSGFTGLPGGYRSTSGQFCYIKYLGLWWTSTEYNISSAWYRRMLCYSDFLDWWRFPKQMGFSVRCIRN